jgi:hypothetical protein
VFQKLGSTVILFNIRLLHYHVFSIKLIYYSKSLRKITTTYISNKLGFLLCLFNKKEDLFMNSQSNTNCNGNHNHNHDCSDPCPPRFAVCQSAAEDLHPLPCPALLECGQGANPRITANFPPVANPIATIPLASVEIDTTCLCSPNVKIEFSTLIQYNATGATSPLVIQLSRSCNGGSRMTLSTFTINLPVPGPTATLPFGFVFCSENVPARDCTYFVDIVSADVGAGEAPFVAFENTFISALAVGCARKC